MKIENDVVIFEEKDEEIKQEFLRLMAQQKELVDAAHKLGDEMELAKAAFQLKLQELDFHRRKNHRVIWGPVDAVLMRDLGFEKAPNMKFNFDTQKITIVPDAQECEGDCEECDGQHSSPTKEQIYQLLDSIFGQKQKDHTKH